MSACFSGNRYAGLILSVEIHSGVPRMSILKTCFFLEHFEGSDVWRSQRSPLGVYPDEDMAERVKGRWYIDIPGVPVGGLARDVFPDFVTNVLQVGFSWIWEEISWNLDVVSVRHFGCGSGRPFLMCRP